MIDANRIPLAAFRDHDGLVPSRVSGDRFLSHRREPVEFRLKNQISRVAATDQEIRWICRALRHSILRGLISHRLTPVAKGPAAANAAENVAG